MKIGRNPFKPVPPSKPEEPPKMGRLLDYRKTTWGHNLYQSRFDFNWYRGQVFSQKGLQVGDVLRTSDLNGLLVTEVKSYYDPPDMYGFTARHVIFLDPETGENLRWANEVGDDT
jgi:hypothetical protein